MHGIVFTSLRHFVLSRHGSEAAAELWAGEPRHEITRAYADQDFHRLLGRLAARADCEADAVMREFGRFAGARTFVMLYPSVYDEAGSPRAFLLGVEERIHRLVRESVDGAHPPSLAVEPLGGDGVTIAYRSARRLCPLVEGLVRGTADHYGVPAEVTERACMRRGAEACVFEARFAP